MYKSKSGVFLIELTLAIFFFTLASVVCIQIFVTSHQLNKDNLEQNASVLWLQNIAECYYSSEGDLNEIISLLSFTSPNLEEYLIYPTDIHGFSLNFDDNFHLTKEVNTYTLSFSIDTFTDHSRTAKLEIYKFNSEKRELLTSIDLFLHQPLSLENLEVTSNE